MDGPRPISIPRTARYFLRGDPSAGPAEVWFVLHGYGQLADDFLAGFDALLEGARACDEVTRRQEIARNPAALLQSGSTPRYHP